MDSKNLPRLAKIKRDLAELRSRLLRIQGEAASGIRDLEEMQGEISRLEASEVRS